MDRPHHDRRSDTEPPIWTVSEAKARLSEILRRATEEGPQRIGTRRGYVVVTEAEWRRCTEERPPMGRWLLDNLTQHGPQGDSIEPPDRRDPPRPDPFAEPG